MAVKSKFDPIIKINGNFTDKLILFFRYVHRFAKTSISFEFITIVELLLPSSFMYAIL